MHITNLLGTYVDTHPKPPPEDDYCHHFDLEVESGLDDGTLLTLYCYPCGACMFSDRWVAPTEVWQEVFLGAAMRHANYPQADVDKIRWTYALGGLNAAEAVMMDIDDDRCRSAQCSSRGGHASPG